MKQIDTQTTPRLSVITPVFNGEKYIEKCIRSVADQGCTEAEHLIIDGGSSDDTIAIVERLAKETPRLRWVSGKDRGQSDAMNKGRDLAHGDILGTLNVDDYYEPGTLNDALKLFTKLPKGSLLVGNCNVRDEHNRLIYINKPRQLSLVAFLLGFQHPVNPCAYFYHTDVHDRAGGFDISEHYTLDVDFLYRAVQVANTVYVDAIWGNFMEIPETKTYEDKSRGDSKPRMQLLKQRYLQSLSFPKRLFIRIARPLLVLGNRTINAIRRPGNR